LLFSPYADSPGPLFAGERFNPLHNVLMNAARHFVSRSLVTMTFAETLDAAVGEAFRRAANLTLFEALLRGLVAALRGNTSDFLPECVFG